MCIKENKKIMKSAHFKSQPSVTPQKNVVAVKKPKVLEEQWPGDSDDASDEPKFNPIKKLGYASRSSSPSQLDDASIDDVYSPTIGVERTKVYSPTTGIERKKVVHQSRAKGDHDENDRMSGGEEPEEASGDEGPGEEDGGNRTFEDDEDEEFGTKDRVLAFPKCSDMTLDSAKARYKMLKERWMIDSSADQMDDVDRSMAVARANFKVDYRDVRQEELDQTNNELETEMRQVCAVINASYKVMDPVELRRIKCDFSKMEQQRYTAYTMLSAIYQQKVSLKMNEVRNDHVKTNSFDRMDEKQELITFLLERCTERQYRRSKKTLYRPMFTPRVNKYDDTGKLIKTSGGYYTHYYKQDKLISDFVRENCTRNIHQQNWKYVSQSRKGVRQSLQDLCDALEFLVDPNLPEIKRDRHKFAFRNGIYLTRIIDENPQNRNQKIVRSQFYRYKDEAIADVDSRNIAAKYFDYKFTWYPDEVDWADIPTPSVDTVLRYQFSHYDDYADISRFMFMVMGRMLFNLGDLENWQFMVHLLGIPGTGKSTILEHVVKEFYEPSNRVELDNKIEDQFGLGGAMNGKDVYLTVSSELGSNCQLDTTHMLKMCSGEEILLAIKHNDPITIVYPSHWMAAENEFPATWVGLGIFRRCLFFMFNRRIRKVDRVSDLKDRLAVEMPNIIQKSVKAYHHYVNKYGRYSGHAKDIWSFCPQYFTDTKEAFQNNANVLLNYFVKSSRIIIAPSLVLSEEDMFTDYKEYCRINKLRCEVRNKEITYQSVIQELNDNFDLNIEYRIETGFCYEGHMRHTTAHYFFGIGLVSKMKPEDVAAIYARHLDIRQIAEEEEKEDGGDGAAPPPTDNEEQEEQQEEQEDNSSEQ